MQGINKVFLVGRLGIDPEAYSFKDGSMITRLSLATSEVWNDKITGERRERTEWHRVVLYNYLADLAFERLQKGMPVYIEGSVRTRKWQDNMGRTHYTTEVHANKIEFITDEIPIQNSSQENVETDNISYHDNDDIPF